MDIDALASRLGVDREDFIELSDLFITTTLADLDKIRQGMEEEDPSKAAAAAHSIKGAAGNLGLSTMAELAQIMEFQAKAGSLNGFDQHLAKLSRLVEALGEDLSGVR